MTTKRRRLVLLASMLLLSLGCHDTPTSPSHPSAIYDFNAGTLGFVAGFADYPPADAPVYFLTADSRTLPEPLDRSRRALYISGVNHSDDLFMFYKGRVSHLEPNRRYQVTFSLEFATNARMGCSGVGGAEDSVWIKAGASTEEPTTVLVDTHLRMTIDKGSQSMGGTQASVLGPITGTVPCSQEPVWQLKTLSGGTLPVEADSSGNAWLIFGSDSGFESLTELYYTRLTVVLDPA
jgi:hypothetical protein